MGQQMIEITGVIEEHSDPHDVAGTLGWKLKNKILETCGSIKSINSTALLQH